ncbi:hypothetical protein BDZ88DRAFT_509740 [Geranomyces variabilis]|nr:hypothetical protein BDZ88DRAFT_509740 [Geranomyces variabilis]KAJ3138558.1 hypothetical protein HDU90_001000 [Geranomyces variabilis]
MTGHHPTTIITKPSDSLLISWKSCLRSAGGGGSGSAYSPIVGAAPAAEDPMHFRVHVPPPIEPGNKTPVGGGDAMSPAHPLLDLSKDVMYASAVVRKRYLAEQIDVLRTAKGVDKRAMAEMFVVKTLEKEIDRIFSHAARKSAELNSAAIPALVTRLAKLTSPFGSTKQMYLVRPFLEEYTRENKLLARRNAGWPAAGTSAGFEAYFTDLKESARIVSKNSRSTVIGNTMKMLVKMEAEFYLLGQFVARSSLELVEFIRRVQELTQNSKWSCDLESNCLARQQRINSWISEARKSFLAVVEGLTPDLTDFECAVCLGTMHKPVQLETCKHRFCRECLHQHARFSAYWSYLYWIDIMCPICRGGYTVRSKVDDKAMDNLIKTYFPREHAAKSREEFRKKIHRKVVTLLRTRIVWRDAFWE